jgi:C4-dicarboxylate transporter/malic acid transport protein
VGTLESRSDVIRHFHPAWFASVMGTGIIAVASHHADTVVPGIESFAVALWLLSVFLFAALIVPWLVRWVRFPREAWADTGHPTRGPFYSTFPIALLVLSVDFVAIGSDHMNADVATSIAQSLWIAGTVLAFVFGIVVPYRWFTGSIAFEQINGAWFIPPVANIVVPAAAAPLISTWSSAEMSQFVALIAFSFFGLGLLLFLALGALLIGRLIQHSLPEAHLSPTLWIGLGPIGVGSLALARLATTATPLFGQSAAEAEVVLRLAAVALWGFGLWWLATAIALTARYLRKPFPFAMSWWAFTFPLGAYTVATFVLGDAYDAGYLTGFAFALWIPLVAVWAVVLVRTLAGAYTGSLLKAPPVPQVADQAAPVVQAVGRSRAARSTVGVTAVGGDRRPPTLEPRRRDHDRG